MLFTFELPLQMLWLVYAKAVACTLQVYCALCLMFRRSTVVHSAVLLVRKAHGMFLNCLRGAPRSDIPLVACFACCKKCARIACRSSPCLHGHLCLDALRNCCCLMLRICMEGSFKYCAGYVLAPMCRPSEWCSPAN